MATKSTTKATKKAEAKVAVKKAAPKTAVTKTTSTTKKTAPALKTAPAKKETVKANAKKTAAPKKVSVLFEANCPLATIVALAGSFNNWDKNANKMKKDKKTGLFVAKIDLLPGDYEYKFVCDNEYWDEGDNKIKHV